MKHLICAAFTLSATAAFADAPVVEDISATKSGDSWQFSVTIRHGDTGWDDYADGWEVIDADGTQLGERPLAHPHVNEQPFTRSQSGIVIPDEVAEVYVRVRDNVHGWYETRYPFTLPE